MRIMYVCNSLIPDLLKFLKDEGRYKYRMIEYTEKITKFFESLPVCEEDERYLYLLSKALKKDYLRLRSRKLSPADSVICIIYRLLSEVTDEAPEEITRIFQMFHENIKNRAKLDKFQKTSELLGSNETGKLRLQSLDLYSVEHPVPRSQELCGESKEWEEVDGREIEL